MDHAGEPPHALRALNEALGPSGGPPRDAAALGALLAGPVLEAARGLLGCRLVRDGPGGRRVGRIVETEAYGGPEDRASHARFGESARAATMHGAPGRAYVYAVYGMHTCLNVVTGPPGHPSAVLLRAVEPLEGLVALRAARLARALATRRIDEANPAAAAVRLGRVAPNRLASGPGNLAAAFGVTLEDDGADLLDPGSLLRLEPAPPGDPASLVATGPRVGVAYAGEPWTSLPWRFALAASPAVSARRLPAQCQP